MKRAIITVGLGFGDEGKGATVDFLTRRLRRRPRRPLLRRQPGRPQRAAARRPAAHLLAVRGRHPGRAERPAPTSAPTSSSTRPRCSARPSTWPSWASTTRPACSPSIPRCLVTTVWHRTLEPAAGAVPRRGQARLLRPGHRRGPQLLAQARRRRRLCRRPPRPGRPPRQARTAAPAGPAGAARLRRPDRRATPCASSTSGT